MSDYKHNETARPQNNRPRPGFGPGGPPGSRPVEKAKNFKGTFARLLHYLRPQRAKLITVFGFAILSTMFTIASPKIMGNAMNVVKDSFVSRMVINQLKDVQNKARTQLQPMVDAFQKMEAAKQAMAEAQAKIALLPPTQRAMAMRQMAAAQAKAMGAAQTGQDAGQAGTESPSGQMPQVSPETISFVKEFMDLPLLSEAKTGPEKEKICRDLYRLSTAMPKDMLDKMSQGEQGKEAAKGFTGNVKFTKEQLNDAFSNIGKTNGKFDYAALGRIMLVLLGMYLFSAGLMFCTQFVMSSVAQKTVANLRREVNDKLGRLPLKYFDGRTHGEILSRVTNDVDTIANTLQQSITQLITSVVQIVGYIIMMLTISPLLTLIVLVTLPLYVVVTMKITKRSQKYFAGQQKSLGALSGHVEEMYSGHTIVKAYGQEQKSIETFKAINEELTKSAWKANFVSGVMFPLMNFISNIGYVLISVVGGMWMTKNWLNLGDITAFIQYSRSFNQPIVQTANIANIIQSTVACAERVFEVLDETEELPDAENAKELPNAKGEVNIKNLAFSYVEDKPLIQDLSLNARPGHTVAIVGPTGAGKTTLVNLLMRFYEIKAGEIDVDGVDIRLLKRDELRSLFGMVLQDTWLFNGTIKENIAYGRDGATDAEIIAAAQAAHADHFIRTLPQGYDTVLNEEASNISQGQKQLLTIARAILADPSILILDEATSSVDTRTEVLIQKAMNNLMQGRTSFVIAHRLSTIRDAELILVMNHGDIVEQGTHLELLAQNGFYADLYKSQFQGQTEEAS
jgi:ATP-binding cassette subfamily B protein